MRLASAKHWLLIAPLLLALQGCNEPDIDSQRSSKIGETANAITEETKDAIETLTGDDPTYDANGELAESWLETEAKPPASPTKPAAPVVPKTEPVQSSGLPWMERALWIALCIIGVMGTYIVASRRPQNEKSD